MSMPASKATSQAQHVSWRNVVKIHPAAHRIPDATEEEQRALAADLIDHGQRMPVVLVRVATRPDAPPQLIDGRTRLDLQEAAGVEVVGSNGKMLVLHRVVEVQNDIEAEYLSLSLNVHRRHLPGEQRDKLIVELIKDDPTKSNRQIAKMVGAVTHTSARCGASWNRAATWKQLPRRSTPEAVPNLRISAAARFQPRYAP